MKDLEKCIEFRKENVVIHLLGVDDVSQIEEGSLFGLIFSEFDLACITPDANYNDTGDLTYNLFDVILSDCGIEVDTEVLDDDLPFIFKKMKGNLAQELLSGEVFVLSGKIKDKKENKLGLSLTPEEFQSVEPQYSNNNVLINCVGIEQVTDKDIPNAFFQVTDIFKALYSNYTLPNKVEIIETLKSIKQKAKKVFDDKLSICIGKTQSIAETENFIYDMEHFNLQNKRESR